MFNQPRHRVVHWCLVSVILFLFWGQSWRSAQASTIYLPFVQRQETELVAAAGASPIVIVQLVAGSDIVQFSHAYQVRIIDAIPALALYRLEAEDARMLMKIAADPRVIWAITDRAVTGFEARQQAYNPRDDFEMLQRYFGSGSGNPYLTPIDATEEVIIIPQEQDFDIIWKTWGILKIQAHAAQAHATGSGIVVAVLDTGVDLDHPLLIAHLIPGYDFVEQDSTPDDLPNGVDDDRDRKIDEGVGHGTHVTGIVTAVAPAAQIMPVRVLNSDGNGLLFQIVQGIVYAVDHGAQVINLSLSAKTDSPLLKAALNYAVDRQVVVIAAASGTHHGLEYPAAYTPVIAVGATQKADEITEFSKPYAAFVDTFAPGEVIYSTYPDGGFAWWSGSSMAAPFVAGEAALLLEGGHCRAACVIDKIMQSVDPVTPNQNPRGRLNLHTAVQAQ